MARIAHHRIRRRLGLLAGCALLAISARGDDMFAPPGGAAQAAAQPASPLDSLEMRGVMTIGPTTMVTLFDTASSKSFVIEMNQSLGGITVKDYQVQDDSVLVLSGSASKRIKMRKAQIAALPINTPPPPLPVPGGIPQPFVAQTPVQPGAPQMSDEEVRQRMQHVAEEIRRRREMRREMLERAQQQNSGVAPQNR